MHLLLYNNLPLNIKESIGDFYELVDVSAELKKECEGSLKYISAKDYAPDLICKKLELISGKVNSITLLSDDLVDWSLITRIACHIRFHSFANEIDQLPIILAFKHIPNLIFDGNTKGAAEIDHFQYETGFFIKSWDFLFSEQKDEIGNKRLGFAIFHQEELLNMRIKHEDLNTIKIRPSHEISSHSITNQWGAVNLARNAGYDDAETDYDYPPTLYFKYLTKKYKTHTCSAAERKEIVSNALSINNPAVQPDSLLPDGKLDLSNHKYLKNKRILLIDDNADKGWKNSLSLLFSSTIDVFSNLLDIKLNNYDTYDIVFLDLYMPNPRKDGKTDMAYTVNILKELKVKFPGIPIVVFTASNKSWTMHEVLEKGADGIYVKESPEYAADPEFSKENFKSFVNTVINCLEKYTVLRPYWEAIQSITNDDYFNSLPEKKNTKFKERIAERLEMFYGLLKKGFQQRQYDKDRFHFSDYELAFMTLWSVLNEISELHYEKNDRKNFILLDKNGTKYKCWPIPNYNWIHLKSSNYLIKYDFEFDSYENDGRPIIMPNGLPKLKAVNPQSHIVKDKFNKTFCLKESNRPEVAREISSQIAFILLNMNSAYDISSYLITVYNLNDIRNKMYLTHGSEVKDGFYSLLERDKRKQTIYNITPTGDIKDLFQLVAFLLTGKELTINI
ncbi:MAG: response regulator [Bacteroidales bacterium]|jgi:DNA-binding NarL/FixJ family response regulator|nr:response regulator [Prolixibacteraceae bacterium]MDY0085952.1 response regulator [Bacteroidales bacterium]